MGWKERVDAFVKERNRVLSSGNIDTVLAWAKRRGLPLPKDPLMQEAGMHKSITACEDLDIELRRKSKAWLIERGFKSFDDGHI